MKIIADIGSCHMNKWDYVKEAIETSKEIGVDSLKFQLFRDNKNGNIELNRDYFVKGVKYARSIGLDCFASAFDVDAILLLHGLEIKKVKLAYSQNFNLKLIKKAKELGMDIWASGDDDNFPTYADVKFWCLPEYPVKRRLNLWNIDFRFEGFSSHYLGIKEDLRILETDPGKKFKYLEKHLTLDRDDIDVPDHWFALAPKEMKELVQCLRGV